MRASHTSLPAPPQSSEPVVRDRLRTFRQLCLVFALFTVGAVAITLGFVPDSHGYPAEAASTAVLLMAVWIYGYMRNGFSTAWLPVEVVLLIGFVHGIANPIAVLGVCYIGVQYRALYGGRRDAVLTAVAYMVAFVLGLAWLPEGPSVMRPVVAVEVIAIGFCAYLLHTLAQALERDVRQAEELRESERRFRSVAENLREALMITDTDDRIILANPRVREVLGYEPEDVLGKSATDLLLPASQRNAFKDRLRRRLDGESELYEIELLRKDGTRIFAEVSASPYRDASGRVVGTLGAISDVTERRRLEERLRHARQMESIGQLAGGIAHDFNNLLTVIRCHTELLLDELRVGDPHREAVTEIARAGQRGAMLTQQLLAFGRKLFLQPRRVMLSQVVSESAPLLRRQVSERVEIVTVTDGSAAQVHADPLQLEHVLVTLVRNASDAMPNGGSVTIETRALDVTDDYPQPATQEMPNGPYVLLTVSDTGAGMTREVQARLFEPFFTTKAPGTGTGLGLASTYGIVRQSGGFVDVDSSPAAGTTVRIYLPVAAAPRPELPPSPALQTA